MESTISGLDELNALLDSYARHFPNRFPQFLQRVGVYLCRSLKARTPKAKKNVRGEAVIVPSAEKPRWLTYDTRHTAKDGPWKTRGAKLTRPLHRYDLTRRPGTDAQRTKAYFVYGDQSKSRQIAELIRLHGQNFHAGLAKASWGWAASKLFTGSGEDLTWKRRAKDRRDPKTDVNAKKTNFVTGPKKGAEIAIANHIDYIGAILPPDALNSASEAAAKSLAYNVEREMDRIIERMSK